MPVDTCQILLFLPGSWWTRWNALSQPQTSHRTQMGRAGHVGSRDGTTACVDCLINTHDCKASVLPLHQSCSHAPAPKLIHQLGCSSPRGALRPAGSKGLAWSSQAADGWECWHIPVTGDGSNSYLICLWVQREEEEVQKRPLLCAYFFREACEVEHMLPRPVWKRLKSPMDKTIFTLSHHLKKRLKLISMVKSYSVINYLTRHLVGA